MRVVSCRTRESLIRRCGSARLMNTGTGSDGRWSKPPIGFGIVFSSTYGALGQDVAPAAETSKLPATACREPLGRNLKRNSIRNLNSYLFWAFIR